MNMGYSGAMRMVMSTRTEQGQVDHMSEMLCTGSAWEGKWLRTAGSVNGR